MTYQLVLQFPGDTLADYDALIAVEELLIVALAGSAEVDGHDCGAGETNLFVRTGDPRASFAQALAVLEPTGCLGDTAGGFSARGRRGVHRLVAGGFQRRVHRRVTRPGLTRALERTSLAGTSVCLAMSVLGQSRRSAFLR